METAFTDQPVLTFNAPPPYQAQAEEAVLGSILIDGEALKTVEFLNPDDFYIERNKWVFIVARDLRRAGQPIDYLTICEALERRGWLGELGGPARVMSLINQTPSSLNCEAYGKIVAEYAGRRRLLQIANELANSAYDYKTPTNGAVSQSIDRLSRVATGTKGARHWSEVISEVYDEVQEAIANPRDITGISTGLPDWDAVSGGLNLGTVTRLVGDPGVGKSLLMMQILVNAAKGGTPSALYELEMKDTQPVRRALSAESRITTAALRTGKITEAQVPAFIHAIECLSKYPVYISGQPRMTTAEIRADATRLKEYHGVQVIAIDYEALIEGPGTTENERRSRISDEVHALAVDLNLAVLSIGDMTKQGIAGETDGQAAAAGTAHEIHNADELVRMKQTKDPRIVGVKWEKLREPGSAANNAIELMRLPGFPAFALVSKRTP